MNLTEYLETSYLVDRVSVSAEYTSQLRQTVRQFAAFLGRPPAWGHFDERDIARYMAHRQAAGRAPSTINREARYLLAIWRSAWDEALVARPPRRIRKIPEPRAVPEAWTVEEVGRLLAHAASLGGLVGCVPRGLWWESLLLAEYWTGCRIGALLRVAVEDYTPKARSLLIRRQKNGHQQRYAIPETAAARLDPLVAFSESPADPLWPWPHCRRYLFSEARKIFETAGIRCPKRPLQLFHRLRRTNLSYCAAIDPAIAQRQADHSSYALTQRHYIDPLIARTKTAADVLPDPTPGPILRVIG